jgi:methyltransferase OMS1
MSAKTTVPPKLPTRPFKVPLGYSLVLISSLGFGFSVLYTYQSYRIKITKPLPSSDEIAAANAALPNIWKQKPQVDNVDADLERDEYWSGIKKRRKEMVGMASGVVLESAVGTGRNIGYYDAKKVWEVTMVDQSRALLDVCKKKWEHESERSKGKEGVPTAQFLVGDLGRDEVGQVLRSSFDGREQSKFDTVVQTMGLCSTPDPVKFLNNLGEVVKEDGRILLLEHGKSHYDWLNLLLDHTALDHAMEHGCWWNRDIGAIIEKSGLRVEEVKRFNFGTLWWIILRPQEKAKELPAVASKATASQPRAWWQIW